MHKYLSLCQEREKFRARLIDVIKQRRKREKEKVFYKIDTCIEEIGKGEEVEEDVIVGNEDDILRYYYYLTQGIDDTYVGLMDVDLLKNILKRIPSKWKEKFKESLNRLVNEVKEEYILNVKMSVIEFVLGDSTYSSLKQVRSAYTIFSIYKFPLDRYSETNEFNNDTVIESAGSVCHWGFSNSVVDLFGFHYQVTIISVIIIVTISYRTFCVYKWNHLKDLTYLRINLNICLLTRRE